MSDHDTIGGGADWTLQKQTDRLEQVRQSEWDHKRAHEDDLDSAASEAWDECIEKDQNERELADFRALAKAQGKSLAGVLHSYVGLERTLRDDPATGLLALARNVGLTPQQMIDHLQGHACTPDGGLAHSHTATLEHDSRTVVAQVMGNMDVKMQTLVGDVIEKGLVPRTGNVRRDLEAAVRVARQQQREQARRARAASRSISSSQHRGKDIDESEYEEPQQQERRKLPSHDEELRAAAEKAWQQLYG